MKNWMTSTLVAGLAFAGLAIAQVGCGGSVEPEGTASEESASTHAVGEGELDPQALDVQDCSVGGGGGRKAKSDGGLVLPHIRTPIPRPRPGPIPE
jgi:hypothetical protein